MRFNQVPQKLGLEIPGLLQSITQYGLFDPFAQRATEPVSQWQGETHLGAIENVRWQVRL